MNHFLGEEALCVFFFSCLSLRFLLSYETRKEPSRGLAVVKVILSFNFLAEAENSDYLPTIRLNI